MMTDREFDVLCKIETHLSRIAEAVNPGSARKLSHDEYINLFSKLIDERMKNAFKAQERD